MKKHTIQQYAQNVLITDFLNYRDYLSALYAKIHEANKSYSYLKFSEDLGFSHTNVSWLIVTGRRSLSPAACDKVLKAIGLKGDSRRYFQVLVNYNNARIPNKREELFQRLMQLKSRTLT